ncbi:MAG: hypothetical protein U1E54_00440, partial [Candidatus Levybacteria bacterium]|nr:hypothetical protein [Candidatus Levybacteria bacterium]
MEKRVASVLIVLMVVSILMVFANARGITGYGIFDEGGIIFLQSSAEIMTPHVEYLDYILDDGSQFLPIIIKDPNTLQDSISATIDGNGQSYPITLNKLQNDPGHFGSDLFYFEGDPGVVLTPGITYVINYGSNSRSIKVSDDGLLNDINTRIDWFTHTERESPNAVFNWIPHTGTFQTSTGLTQNVFRDFERGGHPDGTDFRLYVWAAPEVGAGLGNAKKDLENTDYLSIEPARYAEFGEIAKGYRNLLRDAVIPEQSDEGNITSIINTNSLSLHGLNDEVPIDGLAGFRKKGGTIAGAMHFAMSIENDDPSTATELYEKAKALYRYNSWGASNWPNSGSNPENTLGQEYKISQLRGSAAMALSGQDYPTGMSGSYINDAIARLSELKQLLRTGNGNDVTCMKANWLANTRCTHQRYNVFDQALIDLYDYAVQNGQTNAA